MAVISVDRLTKGSVDGSGVFDVLMAAVNAHIKVEYQNNRIKGTEYATVYLGAMQSCLQTALQFLLAADKTEKEVELLEQEIENAKALECKLRAEYDLLLEQVKKTAAEAALLAQKKITEQAQVTATGVDGDSVIGRQKELYRAQTEGYARDAEQKAAKIVADIIGVQMSVTDYEASPTNKITDNYLGAVMGKLYAGVGATTTPDQALLTGGVLSTTHTFTNTTKQGTYGTLNLHINGSWVYTAKPEYESVAPNVVLADSFEIYSTDSKLFRVNTQILGYEGNTIIRGSVT